MFSGWRGVASAAAEGLVIETFGSVDAFSRYFGGYTTFGSLQNPNQFLCVWGGRGASQFRRFLLERFEDIEVILAQPPAWHFWRVAADEQLSEDERAELERTFAKKP